MNVLLRYPEFPDTFWSFKHALKVIGTKASLPPFPLPLGRHPFHLRPPLPQDLPVAETLMRTLVTPPGVISIVGIHPIAPASVIA
jgi:hypothetical protein